MNRVFALMVSLCFAFGQSAWAGGCGSDGCNSCCNHEGALTLEAACACDSCLADLPAGQHVLVFVHPYTCCPVEVCVCLPCGCKTVSCEKGLCAKKLRFAYKGLCNDVVIKFNKDGSVSVK